MIFQYIHRQYILQEYDILQEYNASDECYIDPIYLIKNFNALCGYRRKT